MFDQEYMRANTIFFVVALVAFAIVVTGCTKTVHIHHPASPSTTVDDLDLGETCWSPCQAAKAARYRAEQDAIAARLASEDPAFGALGFAHEEAAARDAAFERAQDRALLDRYIRLQGEQVQAERALREK